MAQAAPLEKLVVAGDEHPMRVALAGIVVIARDEQNRLPAQVLRQPARYRLQN